MEKHILDKLRMPKGARYIIEQLEKNGFEAFIVGGCVRDCLLGKVPNDWDITTSAKPEQVKSIFSHTVDTGIEHGTVTVLVDKNYLKAEAFNKEEDLPCEEYAFEVTTYRIDGVYEDHRRPKEVSFTSNLVEDLKRRDFTINAMAYNYKDGIIDVFGGVDDLNNKIVKCVGNPTERFNEDALRILRAVRFSAQLGFVIEESTKEAMRNQAKYLEAISAERIQVELTKLITSDNPDKLVDAFELGITKIVLPEFDVMMNTKQNNPNHLYNVGIHTIKVMEKVNKNKIMRYAALLHDVSKPDCKTTGEDGVDHFYGHQNAGEKKAKTILRRLKLDNNTISEVCRLVKYHDYGMDKVGIKAFRRFLGKLGIENFANYIELRKADIGSQSDYNIEKKRESIISLEKMYDEVIDNDQCISLKDLRITGSDLISMGLKPGRNIGMILSTLLERVLDEPKLNDEETLRAMALMLINKIKEEKS